MPTYNYECEEHGVFEARNSIADHAKGVCPTCEAPSKQVILKAPGVDVWGMAKAGMPGAHYTVGNWLEKRHKEAGQYHTTTSEYWRDNQ